MTILRNHPEITMLRRHPLAAGSWIVLIAWLASTAAAFWYFELSDWRPFSPVGAKAAAGPDTALVEQWFRTNVALPAPTERAVRVTFVHLYNPECRCNRFTEPHLQRLMERFQAQGVRFLAAPAPKFAALAHSPFDLPVIRSTGGTLSAARIDTAPAALIFNAEGRLIYYGPYSDSAWCGSAGALVDPILAHAVSGAPTTTEVSGAALPAARLSAARGCFCEWLT